MAPGRSLKGNSLDLIMSPKTLCIISGMQPTIRQDKSIENLEKTIEIEDSQAL
jgi:hypothetical protein